MNAVLQERVATAPVEAVQIDLPPVEHPEDVVAAPAVEERVERVAPSTIE